MVGVKQGEEMDQRGVFLDLPVEAYEAVLENMPHEPETTHDSLEFLRLLTNYLAAHQEQEINVILADEENGTHIVVIGSDEGTDVDLIDDPDIDPHESLREALEDVREGRVYPLQALWDILDNEAE